MKKDDETEQVTLTKPKESNFLCIAPNDPVVECNSSLMGNVMNESTNCLKNENFSAIQTIKYALSSAKNTAVAMFKKGDSTTSKVNPVLINNMNLAHNY